MGSGKKWVLVRCRDLCLSLKFGLWLRCSKISRILSRLDLFPTSGNWTRILCGSEGWPFLSFGTLLEHLHTSLVMIIIMLQWISRRSQKIFVINVEAIWACREYAGAGGCQLLCYLCGTYKTAQWQYIMKILKIKNILGGLFWLPRHRPLSHWQLLVSSLRSEKSRWPQDRYLNYLKAVHQLCWVLPIKTEVVAPKVATATLLLGTPRCQLMPILTSLGEPIMVTIPVH